jgi:hypothetical protein
MSTMQKATNLVGWSLLLSTFILWVDLGRPLIVLLNNPFGIGFAILYWAYMINWAWSGIKKIASNFWKGPPPPPPAVEVFEPHRGNYREKAKVRQVSAIIEAASKIPGPRTDLTITLDQLREDMKRLRTIADVIEQRLREVSGAPACCGSPSSRDLSSCACGASR